jgi:hypothetical protein
MSETNKRVTITKTSNGSVPARKPVGRPSLELDDRYSADLGEYCQFELNRLIELTMANRTRSKLKREQERVERRIDKLLGHEDDSDQD